MEERYIRWVLGVERETSWYMVREETQRDKLRGRAGRRTWRFVERLEQGRGSEIARKYLEKLKSRERRGITRSKWEEERKKFF